jgi:hypothetical protein
MEPRWPPPGAATPSWGHHQAAALLDTVLLVAGAESDEAEADAVADVVVEAAAEVEDEEEGKEEGQPG